MSTQVQENPSNPFQAQGDYSPESIELMRAMSEHRRRTGVQLSTPAEVLDVVKSMGFRFHDSSMTDTDQSRLFTLAIDRYKQQENIVHPSCSDVLAVVERLGFSRRVSDTPTHVPEPGGLPIDRRRREEDSRNSPGERRSSLEPSAQEMLDLTKDEHAFLDHLKELREVTGRAFASSEEILSIVWSLGYRPVGDSGLPIEWLDTEERCHTQAAFTDAVEKRVAADGTAEFLTCRSLLEIVEQLGFRLP